MNYNFLKGIIIYLLVFSAYLYSAPLRFFPAELTQPDGNIINVFLSGDEYYNWVHDADDYTIVQDQNTGYYVYADLINDELVPTSFIVGRADPSAAGLRNSLNISGEKILARRNEFLANSPEDMGDAPTTGTINNLVVYIRFSGEAEFTDTKVKYDTMFNNSVTGANSMYNYFKEVSYNTLSITSTFYPASGGTTVVSYQDSHPRGYFQPYTTSNTIGYTGGSNGTERRTREHTLLVNAVNYVASQVPAGLNLDGDNDGRVDNVCFIVYGSPGAWADLLWPHRWALYTYTVNINGKRVYDYNFQLQTSLSSSGVGVLCHEMFHSLGSPDLYHYTSDGMTPVGAWDVMQTNRNPPQHMGAYMKYRYGDWISSIPVVTNGTFILNPLTSPTGNCYRINSPNSTTEYYVVEYRRKTGTFEGSLPGTGLLVYRINTAVDGQGNANGPPDEVYIYRPNGTTTVNGTINSANYSSNVGRTSISDLTNPSPFLSNGNPGGIKIFNIGSSGETISFTIGIPDPITNLAVQNPTSGSLTLQWTVPSSGITGYDIRRSTSPITDTISFFNAEQLPYSGIPGSQGSLESFLVEGLNPSSTYFFSVRSYNIPDNLSGLSNPASGVTLISPLILVNPYAINHVFEQGNVYIDTLRISNVRSMPSTLDFNISFQNNTFPGSVLKTAILPGTELIEGSPEDEKINQPQGNRVNIDGHGGPDAFGYEWIDSNEPGGPSYIWEDIRFTGTLVSTWYPTGTYNAKDEGYAGPFPLGFSFKFYDNEKSQVYISSNGLLTFNPITTNIPTNNPIPIAAVPNDFIAPFWDDLDGSNQGTVYYKQDGSRFIVQYTNWPRYGQASSLTFQVVLHSNGRIFFYYNNMNSITLNSSTVGIENSSGTVGLQVVYNSSYITNGLAVMLADDPDWVSGSTTSGRIYSGNFVDIILTFTTDELPPGMYSMDIVIYNNDPGNSEVTVPVTMQLQNIVTLSSFKAIIEGLYNDTMVPDTVTVELRRSTPPFAVSDQIKILLDSTGTGTGLFTYAANGEAYYFVVKHRNGLETWSSSAETVISNSLSYDFTTSASAAYGDNLIQKGGKWCIYSGDINGDGIIDVNDLITAAISAAYFSSGYLVEDVNGDMIVDLQDISIIENNKNKGVITPGQYKTGINQ